MALKAARLLSAILLGALSLTTAAPHAMALSTAPGAAQAAILIAPDAASGASLATPGASLATPGASLAASGASVPASLAAPGASEAASLAASLAPPDAAAEAPTSLIVEQAWANMPEVTVCLRTNNGAAFEAGQMTARLGEAPLTVESVTSAAEAGEGVCYYFLIDVSGSIKGDQITAVKQALGDFRRGMQEQDRFVLISFGEYIDVMLDGSEDAQAALSSIDGLTATENWTRFHDAVVKAIEMADARREGFPQRKVAIVISDGIDEVDGLGHTPAEVQARLKDNSMPVYGLAFANGDSLDAFGQIARESGGAIQTAASADLAEKLALFVDQINAVRICRLKAASNHADGDWHNLNIDLSFDGRTVSKSFQILTKDWQPDEQAPVVTGVEQLDESTVRVRYSEPVAGADVAENFIVKDADGTSLGLSASYAQDEQGCFTDLHFAQAPYEGQYSLEFAGIHDLSMEANALAGKKSLTLSGAPVAVKVLKIVFLDFWWAFLILAIIVIALIAFRVLRKRRGLVRIDGSIGFGEAVEFKHRFETPASRKVTMIVTDSKGQATRVDIDISSSIFVGRSSINNLSFNDEKMSRQHFVIEAAEDGFFITDLQTTNGTFVNGLELQGRRRLEADDVITAGREKFIFRGAAS